MSSNLPSTWRLARLQEVCEINPRDVGPQNGRTKVSFVPMSAVSDTEGEILTHESRPFNDVSKGYTRFREGDVIFAKITPCMENGKIAVAKKLEGGFACGSTEFHVFRGNGSITPDYLWRYLRQRSFREDAETHMTGAVGQRRVPTQYLKETTIPVPPIPEQVCINTKLGDLSKRSKAAREELVRIPRLVQRYKQAVLIAAFSGELTADWRKQNCAPSKANLTAEVAKLRSDWFRQSGTKEKPPLPASWKPDLDLPSTWRLTSVDQIAVVVQYGTSAKTLDSAKNGVPVLRMGNIVDGELSYDNLKYLPKSYEGFPNLLLADRDILFNRTNSAELVGKTAVYFEEGQLTSFASYLIRLRVVGYLPELLSAYINSEFGRTWVRSVVNQQTGQANVNGTKLRELGIPLVPMTEQNELWKRIKNAFASINTLLTESNRARNLLDRLDESILAKAFRGELLQEEKPIDTVAVR